MAHVTPHWKQPSHAEVQDVQYGSEGFTTKSVSKVNLPPFGLFAKLAFPPCNLAQEPTYATVQFGRNKHLNLNSDLLYINHSCDPSLIFDTGNLNVIAGPKGLKIGEELTFFYPSTEWHMAQPFDCLCGTPTCRGLIGGAKDMPREKLDGLWINGHIREMLEDEKPTNGTGKTSENGVLQTGSKRENTATGTPSDSDDATVAALKTALTNAEKVVESARSALQYYLDQQRGGTLDAEKPIKVVAGSQDRGVTSREMSGEMGGDTTTAAAVAN